MTGELAALGAAFLWAVASIIFAGIGAHIEPINLNLTRGMPACCTMGRTIAWAAENQSAVTE